MRVIVLSSGSKGNTTYIETENTRILIDAGNTCKYILNKLWKELCYFMIFILLFSLFLIWTIMEFRRNYIKANEEYDRTKKIMKAKIISYNKERDTSGYADARETPLSKSTYFVGKSISYSNTAMVQIIETGEVVPCTFGILVSEKKYPIGKIINVYYSKGKNGYDVRSEDYPELFKKSRNI